MVLDTRHNWKSCRKWIRAYWLYKTNKQALSGNPGALKRREPGSNGCTLDIFNGISFILRNLLDRVSNAPRRLPENDAGSAIISKTYIQGTVNQRQMHNIILWHRSSKQICLCHRDEDRNQADPLYVLCPPLVGGNASRECIQ